ncbi:MAG: serine hydrolase [Oscillospiraceae bacterium]|nr:serine hydrolase [Oscillospiraceae bacterium]
MNAAVYREKIEREVKAWAMPSIAVGILKDGETVMAEGFGYADVDGRRKPDADTLYQIGSCSKAFTAAAAAILADQGKLDWDKPAREYLPWLRFKESFMTENVSVRDLLCHRTGLPRYDAYWVGSACTRRDMVENLRNMDRVCGFRAGWNYQNFCYVAVGMIVEEISGMSWEQFVQENLLDPLGMTRTFFWLDDMAEQENRSFPYEPENELEGTGMKRVDHLRFPAENREAGVGAPYGPAGAIISCISDMMKWVKFQLNKGKVGDKQIISEKNMREMHRINMIMEKPLLADHPEQDLHGYGMGWFVESHRGHKVIHHGGNVNGYSAHMFFVPDLDLASVTLINFGHARMTWAMMYDTIDEALGIEDGNWHERMRGMVQKQVEAGKKHLEKLEEERVADTKPAHPMADYAGTYETAAYGDIVVREENGELFLKYNLLKEGKLEHYHYETFRVNDASCDFNFMQIHFKTDPKGKVCGLEIAIGDPRQKAEFYTRKPETAKAEA